MSRNAAEWVPVTIVTQQVEKRTIRGPEPRLRSRWSNLRKLRWLASAIMSEHPGVVLYVEKSRSWTNGRFNYGLFSVLGPGWSWSALSFDKAWTVLNGIEGGLKIAALSRGGVE